ncbi:beta-galactosidase [Microbacterium sp.]|uniref:glycoside hydrolase family 35 protein n=1 Tax=Microbacterium sp. TaxID=51671 RepID=UPI003C71D42A
MTTFSIGETDFLRDGAPFRVLSGALHYFRIHPDHWADRIHKARLLGLNTIETYVAWNAHEPRLGEWDETGPNDLGRFLDLVAAEGLHAIVRPGPYICAEWHGGGLPVWLTATGGIGLRRSEAQYLSAVSAYLKRVYDIVRPRQVDTGGSVILVQIENEYGAYGSDAAYLAELVRLTREAGITVPLTTVDQPIPWMLERGGIDGVLRTGSFGSRATERLAALRDAQPTGPLMCSEFWDGWFDWWGGVHHTTSPAEAARELDTMLAAGASVNLYMLHGGTNFGLTNGANEKGRYLPITTSYDYDAPLDEAGHPTPKFWAFREVIARYAPVPDEVPDAAPAAPVFKIELTSASAGNAATAPAEPRETTTRPRTFEELGHLGALVRYEASLAGRGGLLELGGLRDAAWVSVDGIRVGSLSRTRGESTLPIPAGERLTVLVEEQGRVNYGPLIGESKGLTAAPRLDGRALTEWASTPVEVSPASAEPELDVRTGTFTLDAPADLHLDTTGWGKGYAFVGDFLLGRFWSNGPQRTLYVPGPITRAGTNTLTVVSLEGPAVASARFVERADLGPTEE